MEQENYFDRQNLVFKEFDDSLSQKIKDTRLLVIGAGAGGNEVLKNLALMGFGNFTIVDFDPIEASNLSKSTLFTKDDIGRSKAEVAAETLLKISLHQNPTIKAHDSKIQTLGKQIFCDHDIVVCCVDTDNARIYINEWCVILKKPLFELGFEKFTIQARFFPNETETDSCLREEMGFGDFNGRRQGCSQLKANDMQLRVIPTIQVAASFAGTMIAYEVLAYLAGKSKLKNKVLQYNAEYHTIFLISIPQNPSCHLHKNLTVQVEYCELTNKNTARELLLYLKNKYTEEFLIKFNEEFIYSFPCEGCGKDIYTKRFISDIYDWERWCEDCSKQIPYEERPISTEWVKFQELHCLAPFYDAFLDKPMEEFGIVNHDLIAVQSVFRLDNSFYIGIA